MSWSELRGAVWIAVYAMCSLVATVGVPTWVHIMFSVEGGEVRDGLSAAWPWEQLGAGYVRYVPSRVTV